MADEHARLTEALAHLEVAQAATRWARPDDAQDAIRHQVAAAAGLVREVLDAPRGEVDVERRALLKLGGLMATASLTPHEALRRFTEVSRGPRRVDLAVLDAAADVTDALSRAYLVARPPDLRLLVHRQLERLADLQRRTVVNGGRTRLAGLIADAAGFAGVLAADLGRGAEAQAHYALAQQAAREADPVTAATLHWLIEAQVALTHSPFFRTAAPSGSRVAAALDRAAGGLPPQAPLRARAWVHAHAAKEAAAVGDARRAGWHLDAAAGLHAARFQDPSIGGFYSSTGWLAYLDQPRWVQEYAAKVQMGLQQPAAETTLLDVIAQVGDLRRRASTLADLVDHRLRRDDRDGAAEAGEEALALAEAHGLGRIALRVQGLSGQR